MAVEFSDQVSEVASRRVLSLNAALAAEPISGVVETIPTYRSLTLIYDPHLIRGSALGVELSRRAAQADAVEGAGRQLEFPILYGGEHLPDLEELSAMKGISVEGIIDLHLAVEYRVYMIGFAPGFAYLGGLPEVLHTPRLTMPRPRIEAGAIGIGGKQSSISSMPGPSGWRFVGRTPLCLFDPARTDPFLVRAGDRIRFRRIEVDEARDLDRRVADGEIALKEIA